MGINDIDIKQHLVNIVALFVSLYFLLVPIQNWVISNKWTDIQIIVIFISSAIFYIAWFGISYLMTYFLKKKGYIE